MKDLARIIVKAVKFRDARLAEFEARRQLEQEPDATDESVDRNFLMQTRKSATDCAAALLAAVVDKAGL